MFYKEELCNKGLPPPVRYITVLYITTYSTKQKTLFINFNSVKTKNVSFIVQTQIMSFQMCKFLVISSTDANYVTQLILFTFYSVSETSLLRVLVMEHVLVLGNILPLAFQHLWTVPKSVWF